MYYRRKIEEMKKTTMLKQLGVLTIEQRKKLLEELDTKLEKGLDEKTRLMRDLLVDCIDKRDKE